MPPRAWVAPYLPEARTGGRPRTTDLRAVLNAIFYLLRTGCQWRLLPREFPRPGTVYHYFRAWKEAGVLAELQRALHAQARLETRKNQGLRFFHFGCHLHSGMPTRQRGAPGFVQHLS